MLITTTVTVKCKWRFFSVSGYCLCTAKTGLFYCCSQMLLIVWHLFIVVVCVYVCGQGHAVVQCGQSEDSLKGSSLLFYPVGSGESRW